MAKWGESLGMPDDFAECFPGVDADTVLQREAVSRNGNAPESFGVYPGDPEYDQFDTLYPQGATNEGDSGLDIEGKVYPEQ